MVKKQKAEKVTSKNKPTGVAILSILGYIGAALLLIAAILFFFGGAFLASLTSYLPAPVLGFVGAFVGVILLVFAAIEFLIARGLWDGKNWARIVVLVFSVLGFLNSLFSFEIVSLIINGVVIWYLGFNETAKAYFN